MQWWCCRVFLVGAPRDRAVLCTTTKSFYLTKEDTSNLRLLTEHSDWKPRDDEESRSSAGERDEIVVRGSALFHFLVRHHRSRISLSSLSLVFPHDIDV